MNLLCALQPCDLLWCRGEGAAPSGCSTENWSFLGMFSSVKQSSGEMWRKMAPDKAQWRNRYTTSCPPNQRFSEGSPAVGLFLPPNRVLHWIMASFLHCGGTATDWHREGWYSDPLRCPQSSLGCWGDSRPVPEVTSRDLRNSLIGYPSTRCRV